MDGIHAGSSCHGATFCASRNGSATHVNEQSVRIAHFAPWRNSWNEGRPSKPTALYTPMRSVRWNHPVAEVAHVDHLQLDAPVAGARIAAAVDAHGPVREAVGRSAGTDDQPGTDVRDAPGPRGLRRFSLRALSGPVRLPVTFSVVSSFSVPTGVSSSVGSFVSPSFG